MWAKIEGRQTKQEKSELSGSSPYKKPPAIANKPSDIIVREERENEASRPIGISAQKMVGMILVPNEQQTSIDEDCIYEEIAANSKLAQPRKGYGLAYSPNAMAMKIKPKSST